MMNGYYTKVNVELEPSDKLLNYSRPGNICLGVLHIFFGLFSIGLGVAAICTLASGYFIGYGIWCGFLFLLTGIIAIVAGAVQNTCMITTNMVFALIALSAGCTQFALGVVAAYTDYPGRRSSVLTPYGQSNGVNAICSQYDIFCPFNNPVKLMCSQSQPISWSNAWGPVDVMLLIVGGLEALTAGVAAILCCVSICCGERELPAGSGSGVNYYRGAGSTGFLNEGYATEGRSVMSEPPLYKVM